MYDKKKIGGLIFVIFIGVIFFYLYNIFFDWFNSLTGLFGTFVVSMIVIAFIKAITFSLPFYFLTKKYLFSKINIKTNRWFDLTIILAIVLFYTGTNAIYYFTGGSDIDNLDSILWDKEVKNVIGQLNCWDQTGQFEVGRVVECKVVSPELKSYKNVTITLYLKDGNASVTKEMKFAALENTRVIYFQIEGVTTDNKTVYMETIREFTFPTHEEVMETKNIRAGYFIALLGVILFSLPPAIKTLREIYRNE